MTRTTTQEPPALRNAEIVAADGNVPEWIMILRTGTWLGHPQAQEIVTPTHLQSALAEFGRHYAAHGADLVVDYHHASMRAAVSMDIKAPAAGWIRAMELRNSNTELWGRVDWTEDAAAAIARREYRRLSPVLLFDRPDRVTGEPVPLQLHSVALTNTPFMTDLESLNSNAGGMDAADTTTPSDGGRSMTLIEMLAKALGIEPGEVAASLGLDAGADDNAVAAAVQALAAKVKDLTDAADAAKAAADAAEAAPEVPAEVANALGLEAPNLKAVRTEVLRLRAGADLAPYANALGLDAGAGGQDVLNAIGELQTSRRKSDAEELVDGAVEAGKIAPASRAFYLNAAQADLESASEVINSLPVLTAPSGLAGRKADVGAEGELTDEQKAMCKTLGIPEENFKLGLTG